MNKDFNIEEFLSLKGYDTETRISRRKGSGGSQEFFTPYELVKHMGDKISEESWNNPDEKFLEPSAGNFNFILYIIWNKIIHGSTWKQALSTTYGVELMEDNVQEGYERIHNLLKGMEINYDIEEANKIMKHNMVCSDFFKWDFDNWCPIKENKCEPLF